MINSVKLDDLSRMYRLFSLVPSGLSTLKKAFKNTIIRRGKDLNAASHSGEGLTETADDNVDDPKGKGKSKVKSSPISQTLQLALKWVEDVLELKDTFDKVWTDACQSNRDIESGMNEVPQLAWLHR